MKLKFSYAAGKIAKAFEDKQTPIAKAAMAAMKDVTTVAKADGRKAISAGGGGLKKMQNALRSEVYPNRGGKTSMTPAGHLWVRSNWFGIHQTGGGISGSPWLWIPLSTTPRIGRSHATPQSYRAKVGPLQFIHPPGRRPLLVAAIRVTAKRGQKAISIGQLRRGTSGKTGTIRSVPIFVGVPNVTIKKRLSVVEAIQKAAAKLPGLYSRYLKDE